VNEIKTHTIVSSVKVSGLERWLSIFFITAFLIVMTAVIYKLNLNESLPELTVLLLAGFAGWTDLWKRTIPNVLILAGLILVVFLILTGQLLWPASLLFGAGTLLSVLAIRWLGQLLYCKAGFGMGDAKLFMVLGMLMGGEVFWVLYLSVMMAGVFAIAGMALGSLRRDSNLAFAPFIACAVLINFYWISWNQIWRWLVW